MPEIPQQNIYLTLMEIDITRHKPSWLKSKMAEPTTENLPTLGRLLRYLGQITVCFPFYFYLGGITLSAVTRSRAARSFYFRPATK